jgi:hypothetical protein
MRPMRVSPARTGLRERRQASGCCRRRRACGMTRGPKDTEGGHPCVEFLASLRRQRRDPHCASARCDPGRARGRSRREPRHLRPDGSQPSNARADDLLVCTCGVLRAAGVIGTTSSHDCLTRQIPATLSAPRQRSGTGETHCRSSAGIVKGSVSPRIATGQREAQ